MRLDDKAIDKTIPVPLYYQLKNHLADYIALCKDGDPIPTELELCEHFKVSRPTVRQAVNELVFEGALRRIKGKGTFVSKSKVQRDFRLTFETFDQEMLARGRTPETRILSVRLTDAGRRVADSLSISPGTPIYELERLRLTNGTPLSFVISYLPADLVPHFNEDTEALRALHKRLESFYGYRLARATRVIEAVSASKEKADILQTSLGSPIQYIETSVFIESDRCIEFSNAWYRGDQSRFSIELHRAHLRPGE